MNPFWAYNIYTAKQTKNRDEVIRLNNTIKWMVFGEMPPENEVITKEELKIANAIKEGLPADYVNKNQLMEPFKLSYRCKNTFLLCSLELN